MPDKSHELRCDGVAGSMHEDPNPDSTTIENLRLSNTPEKAYADGSRRYLAALVQHCNIASCCVGWWQPIGPAQLNYILTLMKQHG